MKRKGTFNVGVNPSDIAVTRDQRFAYVTNSNFYEIKGQSSVTVLDLVKGVPKLTIFDPSFKEPYRVAVNSHYAYVCNSASPTQVGQTGTVSIIDLCTNTVTGVIAGFDGPGAIALSKTKAYVTNYGAPGGVKSGNGRTVSVVDLKTKQIEAVINVAQAPAALTLSHDQRRLYVMSYVDGLPGTGVLTVIDTKTNTVRATVTGFFGPFSIALTPCQSRAYVTNFGSNDFAPFGTTVSEVNLKTLKIVKSIQVGIQPAGIAIDRTGSFAYVSNYNTLYSDTGFQGLTEGEGTVNIIRLSDGRVVAPTVVVGESPSTLTLSHDGRHLFVCKYMQNTIADMLLQPICAPRKSLCSIARKSPAVKKSHRGKNPQKCSSRCSRQG